MNSAAARMGRAPIRSWRPLVVLSRLYARPASALGTSLVVLFLLLAALGPLLAPYDLNQQIAADSSQAPSARHWLGTDHLGRDVFSRVVLGTREVLLLAGLGTGLAVAAGTGLGLLGGYLGGLFDELLTRLFDALLSIPALLLALLLLGSIGGSGSSVLLVLLVVYTPIVGRVVRSVVLAVKPSSFVSVARLQGESLGRILYREILPSAVPALTVETALRFSYAIFLIASLGFLGIGVQPPSPNWGLMVSEGRGFATQTPWALYAPAAAIAALIVGVNLMADGLRQAMEAPA